MSSSHPSLNRSPSPVFTRHPPSRLPSLPSTELLNSIACGAHYSGALPAQSNKPLLSEGSWRARRLDQSADGLESRFQDVLDDLLQLYDCKPTLEILHRRFRHDAVIEHLLFVCIGLRDITTVAFAMPHYIASSERVSARIVFTGHSPNRLIFIHTQRYTFRLIRATKEVTSVIFVELDDDMRIRRLIDQRNGGGSPGGRTASFFRTLLTKVLSWTTRPPREPKLSPETAKLPQETEGSPN